MTDSATTQSRHQLQVEDLLQSLPEDAAFLSSQGHASISLPAGRAFQTFPLSSAYVREYLAVRFSERNGLQPNPQALRDAIAAFRARAHTSGLTQPLDIRIVATSTASAPVIYIDLANNAGEAIEITPSSWRVTTTPPVLFQSTRGQQELPHPSQDPSAPLLNSFTPQLFNSLLPFLGSPPFPVLILHGPPGSGKTTLARMVRALIDPVNAPIQPLPSRGSAVLDLARRDRVLVFDHITRMSSSVADALCQITSGTAVTVREPGDRHREPLRLHLARPVILTTPSLGVNGWLPRPDLASRAIAIHLPAIDKPRPECDLWTEFETARPAILGRLYTALSESLLTPAPQPPSDPEAVRAAIQHSSCQADPVFKSLIFFTETHPEWTGTAADLATELCVSLSPRSLAHSLRVLKSTLAGSHITLEFHRLHAGVRRIRILRHPPPSFETPAPPPASPLLLPSASSPMYNGIDD